MALLPGTVTLKSNTVEPSSSLVEGTLQYNLYNVLYPVFKILFKTPLDKDGAYDKLSSSEKIIVDQQIEQNSVNWANALAVVMSPVITDHIKTADVKGVKTTLDDGTPISTGFSGRTLEVFVGGAGSNRALPTFADLVAGVYPAVGSVQDSKEADATQNNEGYLE